MTKHAGPRALADLNAGSITANVWIDAAPERVFTALSSDEIVQWWGSSETYRTTGWEADVREGGHWCVSGLSSEGKPFTVSGQYLEVDRPRKLALTWRHERDDGPPTVVTYLLDAVDDGTYLTVHHNGFGADRQSCDDHSKGWHRVLGWLRSHFEAVQ